MNNFNKEIAGRRPACCNTAYHIKQVALLINEPVRTLQAVYDGEMEISKQLDAKLCDEFNRPKGYFINQNKPRIGVDINKYLGVQNA